MYNDWDPNVPSLPGWLQKFLLLTVVFLVVAPFFLFTNGTPVHGAGTVVMTTTRVSAAVYRYDLAWTSTAGGAVSGNAVSLPPGDIFQVEIINGAAQPTDLYDVQLVEGNGSLNTLGTAGDNISNASSKLVQFVPAVYLNATLDLVIANAGSAKTGTVMIWVRQ